MNHVRPLNLVELEVLFRLSGERERERGLQKGPRSSDSAR